MDDFVIKGGAQSLTGLVGVQAADAHRVGGRVVGKPAGELATGEVANADDVPFLELAGHLDDADGQQAFRARFQSVARAVVDDVMPTGPRGQPDPALAGAVSRAMSQE